MANQTFSQYQTLIGGLDPLTTEIFSKIGQATPLLQVLDVFPMTEKASMTWLKETGLPVTETRALNGTITATVGDNAKVTKEFGRISSLVSLDDMFNNVERADQVEKQGRSVGLFINNLLWKGDVGVDSDGFDGIEKYTTENGKVIPQTAGALSIGSLDEAITEMDAQIPNSRKAFYMNTKMFQRFQRAQRDGLLGNLNFGPNEAGLFILTYNGIPLKQAGVQADGSQVLAFDEGVGTDECSIYLVDENPSSIRSVIHNPQAVKKIETDFGTNFPVNINMLLQQRETCATFRISDILDLPIVA